SSLPHRHPDTNLVMYSQGAFAASGGTGAAVSAACDRHPAFATICRSSAAIPALACADGFRYMPRVTEILFYHLQSRSLEAVLPKLVEKSLEKAWGVVVQGTTRERLAALDERLWSFDEASFLPHATDEDGD